MRILPVLVVLAAPAIAAAESTLELAEVRSVFAAGAPPATTPPAPPTIDDASIVAAIDARMDATRKCLDVRKQRRKGGEALVFAAVDKKGRVVRIDAAGLGDWRDENCLKTALRAAKLPASARGGAIVLKLRVGFVPPPPPADPAAMSIPPSTDLRIGAGKGTPGAPRVEIGEPGTSELPAAAVKKVVAAKKAAAAIRGCYTAELARAPDLAGKVVVRFTIAIDGFVTSASVTEPLHPAVDACVVAAIQKLKFAANKKSTVVSFPLTFRSD